MGFISTHLIKEALDAVGQTQLKQSEQDSFKSFNPILIIKQISARTSCQTHRPESHEHTSRYEHSGQPISITKYSGVVMNKRQTSKRGPANHKQISERKNNSSVSIGEHLEN